MLQIYQRFEKGDEHPMDISPALLIYLLDLIPKLEELYLQLPSIY